MLKKADHLRPGDRILFVIGEHCRFDVVEDVRSVRDGMVHVDINDFTGISIFHEDERLEVA